MATRSGDIERGAGVKNNRVNNNNNAAPLATYYRDDDSEDEQWTSWLIPFIVVTNIAVFVFIMFMNNCPKHHKNGGGKCVAKFLGRFSFESLHQNPLFGPSSGTLDKLGALHWYNIVHKHQGWRLFTSMWLHAGVIHLVINMLSLIFVGIRLEQQFGFVKIGIIYLLSGFGGSVLSSLFIQKSITVGASGALFGLLGAMLAELITNWTIYSNKVAALVTLTVIILVNLAVGILPFADNFSHIGGFLTGLLLGFVLLPRPKMGWLTTGNIPSSVRVRSKYKAYQLVLWVISLLLLIVGTTVALVMLFRGDNGHRHCHWCRYLNCVPTSKWQCDV